MRRTHLVQPLVNFGKFLPDLFKLTINLFKPLIDLFKLTINLFKPLIDLFKLTINLFEPLIDLFKPICHILPYSPNFDGQYGQAVGNNLCLLSLFSG